MNDVDPHQDRRQGNWLENIFNPRSVAVVGASDDIKVPGGRVFRFMISYGYAGQIYAVNPKREVVQGRRTYPSVADLPGPVDFAVIVVSAAATLEALEQCGLLGVPVVMVGSAGFSEAGPEGAIMQLQLAEIAKRHGIRLIGPNTNGIINCRNGFVPTFTPSLDQKELKIVDGPVAIVSQSGAIGAGLFYDGQRRGLRIGRLFNTGNEIDISLEMVIDALLEPSSGISTVLCYVEGLRHPELFVQVARKAARLGKRIVMLKAGATASGARAAAAHTASLAGEDRVYDGILHELGVIRATGYNNLLDVGRVLAAYPTHFGGRASIASISGGIGIMLTDALERAGMGLAPMPEAVQHALDPLLPPFLGRQNPLDVAGGPFHYLERLRSMLQIFDANPESDFSIIAVGSFERIQADIAEVLIDEAARLKKPLFVVWFGGGDVASQKLNVAGVPCFPDAERLVAAVAPVFAARKRSFAGTAMVDEFVPDATTARAVIAAVRRAGGNVIDEFEGKKILAAYGIDVVAERLVTHADGCAEAVSGLRFPLVAKLRSTELIHKARAGGVRLGLATPEAVVAACAELFALATRLGLSGADVVLQEQVPAGVELLIGAKRDETFGMVVTLGIGGVLTEAWDDVQIRLGEVELDAADMLATLRHRSLLDGAGGRAPVSAVALGPTLARFARLVRELGPELDAVDINPVIVQDNGKPPVAVDTVFFLAS